KPWRSLRTTSFARISASIYCKQTPQPSNKSLKALRFLDSGLHADMEVKVGATTFKAHKAIICAHSEFFRSAFDTNSGFKEAKTNTITLREPITSEAARAMLQFLYRGGYDRRDDADAQFLIDTDVFVAGEISMIHGLKDLAFSYLYNNIDQAMRYSSLSSAMNNIYNFTPEDDRGLRDLLVDTAKNQGSYMHDDADVPEPDKSPDGKELSSLYAVAENVISNAHLLLQRFTKTVGPSNPNHIPFYSSLERSGGFARDLVHTLRTSTIIWEVDVRCKVCAHVTTIPIKAWEEGKATCCGSCDKVYGAEHWMLVE
ncbi:hypothetical protein IWX90DRAFT_491143, partial [Phyllosticta citrichinensis]